MSLCHRCPWKRPPTQRWWAPHPADRKHSNGSTQRVTRLLRIQQPMKDRYKPWRQRRERHQGKVLCVECA